MKQRILFGTTALATAAVVFTQISADSLGPQNPGPDVIVGGLTGTSYWGTSGDKAAYSIGTISCNIGDELLAWFSNNNQHPVITQNIFRLKDGRFEQIGMAWLKHGFCAADSTFCGGCSPHPSCDWLGIGCSDLYGSGLNGNQSLLGPHSEVNPVTGFFPYPHPLPSGNATLRGRIQILVDDLNPDLNPGAQYFGESQYVHPDDAASGTDEANNNNAWRRMFISGSGPWTPIFTDTTVPEEPAILAWQQYEDGVSMEFVDVPDDGRFILGHNCTDNGDGTWHYEYALLNMNSDRCGAEFTVPIAAGATITNVGFHDIDHHSGEPYSTDDWQYDLAGSSITWYCVPYDNDENANALRWSTMFNYWFDADQPPSATAATLGLFRPGSPSSMLIDTCGPVSLVGDLNGDGTVDAADLAILLGAWGPCDDCNDCAADLNGDCTVDSADLALLLGNWS